MCHELGLHRNVSKFSAALSIGETTVETYKRTWFCAINIDLVCSQLMGHPTLIKNGEWDTPFPDWKYEYLAQFNSHVDTIAFDAQINLVTIVSNCQNIGAGVNMLNRKPKIELVLNQLTVWFTKLPVRLNKVKLKVLKLTIIIDGNGVS